jgi:hypothetical protein
VVVGFPLEGYSRPFIASVDNYLRRRGSVRQLALIVFEFQAADTSSYRIAIYQMFMQLFREAR